MVDRLRSRFSVSGLTAIEGARCVDDLTLELASRTWHHRPVIVLDSAEQRVIVELECGFDSFDVPDSLVQIQLRELRDSLRRTRWGGRRLRIETEDVWVL